jgi:dienelactone hydrolase
VAGAAAVLEPRRFTSYVFLALLAVAAGAADAAAVPDPERVHFPSADGKTALVGYLYLPSSDGPHPALVLLHGRSGPYSSLARGVYTAATLSQRHQTWGQFWQTRGYVALLLDSFGPRGYPQGFPRGSYAQRPPEVSEQTVRPLDAYAALAYLRARRDVIADRTGLQGWSNGAMTALVAMSDTAPGIEQPTPDRGFRAALALYPGCGMERVRDRYVPYAPVLMLLASADAEVSPATCHAFAARTRSAGGALEVVAYDGAEHSFDDPGPARQSREANRRAKDDAMALAERFFRVHLGR